VDMGGLFVQTGVAQTEREKLTEVVMFNLNLIQTKGQLFIRAPR